MADKQAVVIKDNEPSFGKTAGKPPSWFARVPTRAIIDKGISHAELRVLASICSYANNQGFAWPNQSTIKKDAGVGQTTVDRAMIKLKRKKHIEIVSCFRSHPKWRRIMGNVYRIIHDDRLETDKLIDDMHNEDPPPAVEVEPDDSPSPPKGKDGNHEEEEGDKELVEAVALSHWYARAAERSTGQLRLVNPRAVEAVVTLFRAGKTADDIKAAAQATLDTRRQAGRDAPHHLGDRVFNK
jgi:hypothetical protein